MKFRKRMKKYNDYGRRTFILLILIGTIILYIINSANPLIIFPIFWVIAVSAIEIVLYKQYKKGVVK